MRPSRRSAAVALVWVSLAAGSGCTDCPGATRLWQEFASTPILSHAKCLTVWLTPSVDQPKGISRCRDVVPRRPVEFRVRSGVDGVPLLVAFANGTLAAAIGGVA